MATFKKVRLMNRVSQTVHEEGRMIAPCCDVKQVYAVKGTIIGSLHHLGLKRRVIHQQGSVWSVMP